MNQALDIVSFAREPWLSFKLAGQRYAVRLSQVSEVIRDALPTPVPGAAPDLLGICHLRGAIVPVMEGHRRLGLQVDAPADPAAARVIVLVHETHRVGLRVDAIGELLQPDAASIELSPGRSGRADDPVCAVMGGLGGFVALLDVVRLCRLGGGLKEVA